MEKKFHQTIDTNLYLTHWKELSEFPMYMPFIRVNRLLREQLYDRQWYRVFRIKLKTSKSTSESSTHATSCLTSFWKRYFLSWTYIKANSLKIYSEFVTRGITSKYSVNKNYDWITAVQKSFTILLRCYVVCYTRRNVMVGTRSSRSDVRWSRRLNVVNPLFRTIFLISTFPRGV
jgi:hypothetical protein